MRVSRFWLLLVILAFLVCLPLEGARRTSKRGKRNRRALARDKDAGKSMLTRWVAGADDWDIWYGKVNRDYFKGVWRLKKYEGTKNNPKNDPGKKAGAHTTGFNDSDWDEVLVPYDWSDKPPNPYGSYAKRGRRKHFKGVGWYRTTFKLKRSSRKNRIILHFDAIEEDAAVYVNGKFVGKHKDVYNSAAKMFRSDTHNPFEIDITDAIERKGENTLAVRVWDSSYSTAGYEGEVDRGGIWLPCYIDHRPSVYATSILVTSNVKAGEIAVRMVLKNTDKSAVKLSLGAVIEPFSSRRYKPVAKVNAQKITLAGVSAAPGESSHNFKIKLENPVPWTPFKPMLYQIVFSADGGGLSKAEIGRERFGFREVTVDKSHFLINGKGVFLRGVRTNCPHVYNSLMASNQSGLIEDWARALKDLNFNLVTARGGHWPRAYFDVFDETGIMVCVVRDDVIPMTSTLPAGYKKYFGDTLRDYYNHPSIIANVAGTYVNAGAPNFVSFSSALYDFYKSVDPTRPVAPAFYMAPTWRKTKTDFYCIREAAGGSATYLDMAARISYLRKSFESKWGAPRPFLIGTADSIGRYHVTSFYKLGIKAKKVGVGRLDMSLAAIMLNYPHHGVGSYLRWSGLERLNWWKYHQSTYYDFLRGSLPQLRMAWKDYAGWALTSWDLPGGAGGVSSKARRSRLFQFVSQMSKPVWVGIKEMSRHYFSGQTVEGKLVIVNNSDKKLENLSLEIEILEPISKMASRLLNKPLEKPLEPMAQVEIPVKFALKKYKTGDDYLLKLVVRKKGKARENIAAYNEYQVFIIGDKERKKNIPASAATVLYESAKNKYTSEMLVKAKVKSRLIADFSDLKGVRILVFGMNSFDAKMTAAASKIRKFLEDGGRVLIFEQKWNGPVPWLPEISWKPNSGASNILGSPTIEIIRPQHPAFKDIPTGAFWLWPGERGGIARYRMYPLTLGAKAFTYHTSHGNTWGMALAEFSVGKGFVIGTTIDATRRYGKDAAATHFISNLLGYALGKSFTGAKAAEPYFPLAAPVPAKAFPVKFGSKANAGLQIDPKSTNDGWADQTDLASATFPRGNVKLRNIPWALPKSNTQKAFIAVGGDNFPTEVAEFKIYQNAEMLYLLVTATGITSDMYRRQIVIAKARLNFARKTGKKSHELEIIAGANISNWDAPVMTLPNADAAWCGYNPNTKKTVGMSIIAFENPNPGVKITTLDLVSERTETTVVLLGITTAKAKRR